MDNVLKIPQTHESVKTDAGLLVRLCDRLRWSLAALAWAMKLPGVVADYDGEDSLTGQHVKIRVGPRFTKLSINGRDYYFDRITGSFNGTGSML